MNKTYFLLSALFFLASVCLLKAEVRLPGFFSDNMVLQRDAPVRIWGWASKNENIEVQFNGQRLKTLADKNGTWEVTLKNMKYGGPFALHVKGKNNSIEFNNILIGDVWYCGGQSNMEMTVKECYNAEEEINNANYPSIRSLRAPKIMNKYPQDEFKNNWLICSPTSVSDFSAVAYFYARYLYRELKIPIGIINVSWGGTGIETWTSKEGLLGLSEKITDKYSPLLDDNFEKNYKKIEDNRNAYYEALKSDPGLSEKWFETSTNYNTWKEIDVPKYWSSTEIGKVSGNVWYNYELVLSKDDMNKPAILSLGIIDDDDETWVNGIKIGNTIKSLPPRRIYKIPSNILKEGINNITVLVYNRSGDGGMVSDGYKYYLQIEGQDLKIPLSGKWRYRKTTVSTDLHYVESTPNPAPTLLYNSMTNPLTKFRIRGAIWYQGEHNVSNAYEYRTLFPNMINTWRKKWGYEFPFYWVQLANFMVLDKTPAESDWAELREAQTMTLSVPGTGQAVICDIGDADNIHPKNKQDVGKRLALIALNKDYGKNDIIYSGPTYQSSEIKGNKIIISFDNIGSGLQSSDKYGYVRGFTITGLDYKFEWAQARIENGKVIVYSEKVTNPVAVRYAWGNNTDASLFNKEGLPAVPFRTDKQKGIIAP